jgi:hypothetical protein
VKIEMVEQDGIMVGEDFSLSFKVKNSSSDRREISKLHIDLHSKYYTGEIKSKITVTPLSGFTLNGKEGNINHRNHLYTIYPVFFSRVANSVKKG